MEDKRRSLVEVFLKKNQEINLSALRKQDDVFVKHILDSLELLKFVKFEDWQTIVDVGTGWWFPLLPLAIECPKVKFTWVDSTKKKISAVYAMVTSLKLENVSLQWSRIENLNQSFDFLIARAVGYIDKLLEWSYGLVKKWWFFCLYKQKSEEEFSDLKKLCNLKKLEIVKVHNYSLFEWDIDRVIYLLKKY